LQVQGLPQKACRKACRDALAQIKAQGKAPPVRPRGSQPLLDSRTLPDMDRKI
jgi:hypothetical protein